MMRLKLLIELLLGLKIIMPVQLILRMLSVQLMLIILFFWA